MKKLLIIFLSGCIYISGCKNDLSEKKSDIDSTAIIKKFTDSISNSEQDKIIDDIIFGMREKEVDEKLYAFYEKNKAGKKGFHKADSIDEYQIGNYKVQDIHCDYDGSNVSEKGHYDSDIIYGVTIMGEWYNHDEYSKAYDQIEYLIKMIESKYKKAYLDWGIPTETNLERVNGLKVKEWKVGRKTIEVSFNRINTVYGNNFYYFIETRIYLPDVEKRVKLKKENIDSAKNVF